MTDPVAEAPTEPKEPKMSKYMCDACGLTRHDGTCEAAALAEVTRQRDLNRMMVKRAREIAGALLDGKTELDGRPIELFSVIAALLIDDRPSTEAEHARADEIWAYLHEGGPEPKPLTHSIGPSRG